MTHTVKLLNSKNQHFQTTLYRHKQTDTYIQYLSRLVIAKRRFSESRTPKGAGPANPGQTSFSLG